MSYTAYFDNAATTYPKPNEVYGFMNDFYRSNGVNVGRGQYNLASKAFRLVDETRQMLLELFHASSKTVVFTPTATEAINLILRGIVIKQNANIYISPFEHNAVARTIYFLQKQIKINVYVLPVSKDKLEYDLKEIKHLFNLNKPDVVIISHASNVCGCVAPIEKICKEAKKYNVITLLDMSQTAGLIDTDLNSDIFDFAVFAGHKTLYGPFGVAGFLLGNIKPKPLIYGGTGIDSANQDLPDSIPERYEAGSLNLLSISGLNAALKWNKQTGISQIYRVEQSNKEKLLSLLEEYENIRVIKPNNSIGVVSCVFDNYSSDNIGNVLSNLNIAVRTGLHCAPSAHKFLGTFPAGTVRFSVSYFTNQHDLDLLKSALDYIRENG